MNWLEVDKQNIWHPFSPLGGETPLYAEKGRGIYIKTSDGRWIIDAISSWWVNIHGHANKRISKAVAKQARKLEQVIFAGFTHEPAIRLSQLLMKLLPDNQAKLFFSDNGSTSVEVALKLAIQYWKNKGNKRHKIIAIDGAYHGDTFGSMSVGERGLFTLPFNDYLFEVDFVPFPTENGKESIKAFKRLVSEETALFIFEPLVQGAAGMRMYNADVLDEMIKLAKSKDIICIADEVMTGFGRTGKVLASDYLKNQPDIFCLSKGITGGFLPMGVTSVSNEIVEAFDSTDYQKTFFHGHSYTANPLACAAAVESMKILNKPSCKKQIAMISEKHLGFIESFDPPDTVSEVRSIGTILRIELKVDDPGYVSLIKEKIYDYFLAQDILLRPLGNVIYLLPPYVIKPQELNRIYKAIKAFFKDS